jgi:hypothetical protein
MAITSWTCDGCGRSPADVDELLRWPVQSEGGTVCDICDPLRDKYAGLARAKIERGGMPQGGGFGVEDGGFERLPEGF